MKIEPAAAASAALATRAAWARPAPEGLELSAAPGAPEDPLSPPKISPGPANGIAAPAPDSAAPAGPGEPPADDTIAAAAAAAAATIHERLKREGLEARYSMDDATRSVVVKIVNATTGELLRQIPGEEALQLASALKRLASGADNTGNSSTGPPERRRRGRRRGAPS
jgi:flagellar protein FlaG